MDSPRQLAVSKCVVAGPAVVIGLGAPSIRRAYKGMFKGSITFPVPHAPSKQNTVQALPSLANNPMHSCPIRPTHAIINFISSLPPHGLSSSPLRAPLWLSSLSYFSSFLLLYALLERRSWFFCKSSSGSASARLFTFLLHGGCSSDVDLRSSGPRWSVGHALKRLLRSPICADCASISDQKLSTWQTKKEEQQSRV